MAEIPNGLELSSEPSTKLARELGLGAAMSIGIGTMICAGIFVLPGIAAAKAGPVVVLAFALCGLVAVLIALCMSELSTGMPLAGGGYLFTVRTFGPMVGMVMGGCLWLSLIFASAFYMVGFGYYVADLLHTSHVLLALLMTALLIGLNFIGANVAGVVKGANRNVLVLKDNGLNEINRILVPTAGGPHAKLGLRVARGVDGALRRLTGPLW